MQSEINLPPPKEIPIPPPPDQKHKKIGSLQRTLSMAYSEEKISLSEALKDRKLFKVFESYCKKNKVVDELYCYREVHQPIYGNHSIIHLLFQILNLKEQASGLSRVKCLEMAGNIITTYFNDQVGASVSLPDEELITGVHQKLKTSFSLDIFDQILSVIDETLNNLFVAFITTKEAKRWRKTVLIAE